MKSAEGEKRGQAAAAVRGFRIPLAREGYPFMAIALAVTMAVFWGTRSWVAGAFFFGLFVFVVAFFRDPEREIPPDPDSIVSPADGRVIKVEKVLDSRFTGAETMKISIFMSLFNVHVNRVPASATVERVVYNPGKFFNASFDKASLENEQNAVIARGPGGRRFVFNQIAGLVARRIVCRLEEGMEIRKGERFGLIRFGSRLDVYLPPETRINVKIGDKVSAGSSILGYWS